MSRLVRTHRHHTLLRVVPVGLFTGGAALMIVALALAIGSGSGSGAVGIHLDAAPTIPIVELPAENQPSPGDSASNGSTWNGSATTRSPPEDSTTIGSPDRSIASVAQVSSVPPVAVGIPTLELREDLVDLGLDADRRLEVPDDPHVLGWYAQGPRPGDEGPAVVVGHVDSQQGPGVFWRLPELEPGDEIVVHREDGSQVRFEVDRLGRWPKDDFPTDEVYRQADGAELRLITCGGPFDTNTSSYRDNVIVFASAVTDTRP